MKSATANDLDEFLNNKKAALPAQNAEGVIIPPVQGNNTLQTINSGLSTGNNTLSQLDSLIGNIARIMDSFNGFVNKGVDSKEKRLSLDYNEKINQRMGVAQNGKQEIKLGTEFREGKENLIRNQKKDVEGSGNAPSNDNIKSHFQAEEIVFQWVEGLLKECSEMEGMTLKAFKDQWINGKKELMQQLSILLKSLANTANNQQDLNLEKPVLDKSQTKLNSIILADIAPEEPETKCTTLKSSGKKKKRKSKKKAKKGGSKK